MLFKCSARDEVGNVSIYCIVVCAMMYADQLLQVSMLPVTNSEGPRG